MAGFRAALDGLGFTEISTPKIVASATESGANVFGLDYFGRPAGMLSAIAERAAAAVELLGLTLPGVPAQIPEIHSADAQELLARHTGEDPRGEPDLAPAHERWLSGWAAREHGSQFLYVTGYPMVKRPFYTHPEPGRPGYSNSFGLLFRGLEIVTGGQRLHRHADYLAALAERADDPGRTRPTWPYSRPACRRTAASR